MLAVGPNPRGREVCVLLLAALCAVAGSSPVWSHAEGPAATKARQGSGQGIADPSLNARVESLLDRMTLEEKIGQLVQYSAGQATGPGTGRTDYKDMIARGQIGSLLNVTNTPLINEYQHIAVEKSRLHIPLLFGLDVIHGFRTEFPIPLGMASTWDPWRRAPSTTWAMARRRRAGITTPRRFPNTRCASSTCLHFTRRQTPAPQV